MSESEARGGGRRPRYTELRRFSRGGRGGGERVLQGGQGVQGQARADGRPGALRTSLP